MIHVVDIDGISLPDMSKKEARETVESGMAAWNGDRVTITILSDDNTAQMLRAKCEFCGVEEDLVIVGRAESKNRISRSDFGVTCRKCRTDHHWMTRRQYDDLMASQMKMLAEFFIRYPESSMALCRIGPNGMKDIIGYASIGVVAKMVADLEGRIVTSMAKNSHHFEYEMRPKKRSEKPDWYRDWFFSRHMGRCFFCRRKIPRMQSTLDHLVPLTRMGPDEGENLVLACSWCNKDKGTMTGQEYMEYIERRRLVGRRLGIDVDIIGDSCCEYQRIVSHRKDHYNNPLVPIIDGYVGVDERCTRKVFESRYCSLCKNDRCSRMPGRIDESEGCVERIGEKSQATRCPREPELARGMAGDEISAGDSFGGGSGSRCEDEKVGVDGDVRLAKNRKKRRREKRHGSPRGHRR